MLRPQAPIAEWILVFMAALTLLVDR